MIEARGLTKLYGPVMAVNDLSFAVRQGEVVGFLGRNGAGKTTTMRMLAGCIAPTRGSAMLGGYDLVERPIQAKRLTGYLPERPPVYDDLTVNEYLAFAARIKGVPRAGVKARMEASAEACGLQDVRKRLIGNLSKGYKQRVGLAQALVHDPQVLILDEPTVGLDPGQIIEIRELIRKLRADHTVILSTHILQEVTASCDKVIVIHRGNVVAQDSVQNLTRQSQRARVVVEGAPSPEDILAALRGIAGVEEAMPDGTGGYRLALAAGSMLRAAVAREVVGRGWNLMELQPVTRTLEEVFLELTGKDKASEDSEKEAAA